jgi:hypothetical protein
MKHAFHSSLDWSHSTDLDAWWDGIYRQIWPNLSGIIRNKANGRAQQLGIDAVIVLPNGRTINVDEKTRKTSYGDIALEHTSVDKPFKPGWICHDLAIDFLGYGFSDTGVAYMLPWPILKAAWNENQEQWKKQYRDVVAKNQTYVSLSTPVPINTLFEAMGQAMIRELTFVPQMQEETI